MTPAMILALAAAGTSLTQAALAVIARLDQDGSLQATPEEVAQLRIEAAKLRALQAKADDDFITMLQKKRDEIST